MESPVVVDKPPEYHGSNERGFPFDEEEGSGAWSELAARHPDIAARLRQRPATWARKRRPSSQDATDDFGDSFSGFDRFPFDDIPPEFREHFPSHWNRRFSERDERSPEPAAPAAPPSPAPPPQQQTAATQTEQVPEPEPEQTLPQYGLRNTVDLGQKSPADPSVDADDRTQRSMSAPPDAPHPNMSAHKRPEPAHSPHQESHSNVRHIPIFVEGRDEPVINKNVEHGAQYAEPKQAYQPPPPPPHIDRDQYFAEDGPVNFHHPPNFTRAFGTPFAKGFRQGPQPFVQQKAYPQGAFARGASPQRAQSPKTEEPFVKVPVHREPAAEPQQRQPPPPRQPSPQHQPPPQQPSPPRDATPPPKPQPSANDPIAQILSIQTDVLNLMTEVENFTGAKNDKRYMFLDEMLTRNLIKLDNIETEGKENIRQARKEAIRCIQKCIAVLEAKADSNGANAALMQDVEMKESSENADEPELVAENGEIEIKDPPKEEEKVELQPERIDEPQVKEEIKEGAKREATPKPQEEKTQEPKMEAAPSELVETPPLAADTRPEETKPEEKTDEQKKDVENKPSPKKKVVKKRDKSKDNKEAAKDSNTDLPKDSNKAEVETGEKVEVMQVGDKGDKPMEVGAASQ